MTSKRICSVVKVLFVLIVVLYALHHISTKLKKHWIKSTDYGPTCEQKRLQTSIPCEKLFQKNTEIFNSPKYLPSPKRWSDRRLINLTSDCSILRKTLCFPKLPLTAEEAEYPLAFAIIVYNDLEQFVKMFQSFYWPQNLYCITYDTKSEQSRELRILIENVARCFPNVITPYEHIQIHYAKFGVLMAAINCLQVLNSENHTWRYLQIFSGHDVALKTNKEMVRIFKILNGSLDSGLLRADPKRWKIKKEPPPQNLVIYKGSFAATLSREFTDFILNDPLSNEYLQWLNGTVVPDEQYWSTLIIVQAPGYFPGGCLLSGKKCSISRYGVWDSDRVRHCKGKFVHESCVFEVRDLPDLIRQYHLVAHKVYLSFQPETFHCMMEWIQNRTYSVKEADHVNLKFYTMLPAVLYRKSQAAGTHFNCKTSVKCSDLTVT